MHRLLIWFSPIFLFASLIVIFSKPALCQNHSEETIELSELAKELEIQEVIIDTNELVINLVKDPRCNFGDFDIVRLEQGYSRDFTGTAITNLYFSIERLLKTQAASTEKVVAKNRYFDLLNLGQSVKIKFNLKKEKQAHLAGFFLCKDSNDVFQGCNDKEAKDIAEILSTYQFDPRKNENSKSVSNPSDKIYFFQPLLIEQNRISFPRYGLGPQGLEKFSRFLERKLAHDPQAKEEIARAIMLQKTLGSNPLVKNQEGLQVLLSGISPGKCSL